MGKLIRPRCPLCGSRLKSAESLGYKTIRLGSDDIILQEFFGRGRIRTLKAYGYDTPEGRPFGKYFLEKIKVVQLMLAKLLGELPSKLSGRLGSFETSPNLVIADLRGGQVSSWVNVK
jgi:hypothetical protein